MQLALTDHAQSRAIGRNIPMDVVQNAYAYGTPVCKRGAVSYQLDRKSMDLIRDDLGRDAVKRFGRYRGIYVVVGDGDQVVTVARQSRRLHR